MARLILLAALSLLPLACHSSSQDSKPEFASIEINTAYGSESPLGQASFEATMSVGTFSLPALPYAYDVSPPLSHQGSASAEQ
jgi:hypothetical protein